MCTPARRGCAIGSAGESSAKQAAPPGRFGVVRGRVVRRRAEHGVRPRRARVDRPAHHRLDVDEGLSLPRLRPGDPAGHTARGGLAESGARATTALAHTVLERPRPPRSALSACCWDPCSQLARISAIQASTSSAERGNAAVRLRQPSAVTTTSSSMRTPMPRNSSGTVRSSVWKYSPGSTVRA